MMLRRSLIFAAGAMATMGWWVSASVRSDKPPADPAARQRFVSLLTSTRATIRGKIAAHAPRGDLRAFGGGGRGGTSRSKP